MAVTSWEESVRAVAVTLAQLATHSSGGSSPATTRGRAGPANPAGHAPNRPRDADEANVHATAHAAAHAAVQDGVPACVLVDVDIEVAVTARAAVLAGAAEVLKELVPSAVRRRSDVDLLGMAERDPVRALGIVLHNRGRPQVSRAPSELLDAALTASPASCRWAAAGRDALLADRIWRALLHPLEDDEAWHAIAQVAALTELIGTLDAGLARMAVEASRPDLVTYLDHSAGLRIIAREVRTLAGSPRSEAGSSRPSLLPSVLRLGGPEPRGIIVPTGGQAAAAAVRRLTMMVKDAPTLAPQQVRIVATLGRDLSILAATAGAITPSGESAREQLGALATALQRVVAGRHGEASLVEHAGPGLEHQIRELAAYTRAALRGRAPHPDTEQASLLAGRLPRLLAVLGQQAWGQVAAKNWAIPDRSERPQARYTIASAHHPDHTPRMLVQLDRAIAAADTLRIPANRRVGGTTRRPGPVMGPALHGAPPAEAQRAQPARPTITAPTHVPRSL